MPVILLGAGFLGGIVVGNGLDGTSKIIKWGVIGGGGYLAAKHLKVI